MADRPGRGGADHELAATRSARDLWRRRAEALQGESNRLLKQVTEEYVARLQSERARLLAEGHLRGVQAGRWWRLGTALGGWRRRPWRIDRLVGECLTLLRGRASPPRPGIRLIDKRLVGLGATPGGQETGNAPGDPPVSPDEQALEEACRRLREQRYEAALECLGRLPDHLRSARRACLIARDCYLETGDLRAALIEIRRALESGRDRELERQARQLLGRLRQTDPGWLPDTGAGPSRHRPAVPGRILHVVQDSLPFVERGRTIRGRSTLLAQLAAGFEPVVVTPVGFPRRQGYEQFATTETLDAVPHHRLDVGPDYRLDEVPADRRLADQAVLTTEIAERVRPALVVAGAGPGDDDPPLVALTVARQVGVPFVCEAPGLLGQAGPGEYHQRLRRQQVRCLREADRVITVTESVRAEIIALGVPAERISVIPAAVDENRFTPRAAEPELRRRYGVEGRPVLGIVSALSEASGAGQLVQAVAALRRQGTEVAGLIVGDGPAREQLERSVAELDLSGQVALTGHVGNDRVADLYALLDLLVVPGVDPLEAGSHPLLGPLEAMAMERPVLAADRPALRELTGSGERGVAFPPGDPEALATVAKELIEDADRRARLGRAGRSWVLAERSIAANARRYAEAFSISPGE